MSDIPCLTHLGRGSAPDNTASPMPAVRSSGRPSDTPLISTPQDRRWCFPDDYDWADLIDRQGLLAGEVNLSGLA